VTDVAAASELARLVQRGEEFDVILLGGSTCAHVNLVDIVLLAAAAPHIPILVTAECDDPERAHAILRAGAKGFLPTSHSLKVLMGALERVRAGGTYVPLALTDAVPAATPQRVQCTPWRELTRRQRDVLALISEGRSNKLIADALKHVREHGQGACQADHTAPQCRQPDAGGIARGPNECGGTNPAGSRRVLVRTCTAEYLRPSGAARGQASTAEEGVRHVRPDDHPHLCPSASRQDRRGGIFRLYEQSLADPDRFWSEHGERIDWIKPFTKVRSASFEGRCAHCVVRGWHAKRIVQLHRSPPSAAGGATAILWEGDDPGEDRA